MENLVNALNSFRDQRVLITGDTGFKGSWLSLWLHQHGAKVFGYALPPEDNSHFQLLGLSKLMLGTSMPISFAACMNDNSINRCIIIHPHQKNQFVDISQVLFFLCLIPLSISAYWFYSFWIIYHLPINYRVIKVKRLLLLKMN